MTSSRPTSIPGFLRRLGFILALVLGASGALGMIWSTFCLPLLYSSFSARKAISEQQLTQMQAFVKALRALRRQPIYVPAGPAPVEGGASGEKDTSSQDLALARQRTKEDGTLADSLLIEELEGSIIHEPHSDAAAGGSQSSPLSLLTRVAPLPAALSSLTTHLGATQTTRTSLLSTLSSFTSHLHSQIFLLSRSTGGNAASYYGGVGLKSLGENLEKEGGLGGGKEKDKVDDGKETWDEIRKEIRAIKGMLLSRRNFSLPAAGARPGAAR